MISKLIASLLGKKVQESVLALDIGSSSIKMMELAVQEGSYKLVSAGVVPTPVGAISSNVIIKQEEVANAIKGLLQANDVKTKNAITAVPGPSAFTKKINMALMPLKDLETNITFEAGNYIPHNINRVYLDYQVTGRKGASAMEVLLVAVKNEVVDSYVKTLELAELDAAIIDVDYFALENMFELNYPEENARTIAILNMGARYTAVAIVANGETVLSGDVSVGGKMYSEALCEALGMNNADAEQAKLGNVPENYDPNLVTETIERTTENVTSELQRQLGFLWNAAATDKPIEALYIAGGAAQIGGFIEELAAKTGLECKFLETFKNVKGLDSFDSDFLEEVAPSMAVSVGLSLRRLGDKVHAV